MVLTAPAPEVPPVYRKGHLRYGMAPEEPAEVID